MMNRKNTRLINRIKDLLFVPFAILLIVAFSAYSGKPAEAAAGTAEATVEPLRQGLDYQDKVVEKDTTKRMTIFINGHLMTITDLNSVKSLPGNIQIFKNSGDKWTVYASDTLNNLWQTGVDSSSTVLLIDADSKEEVLGILTATDTSDVGTGGIILEKQANRIEIRTAKGRARMAFYLDKGDSGIQIRLSDDGQGKDLLYMVDGKECKDGEWSLTDMDQIQIIRILDSVAAMKLFGEKGKHGAIEITTKK